MECSGRDTFTRRWSYLLLLLGFVAIGALLALIVPNDLYVRSAGVRMFVDGVATVIPSIHEFAGVSRFPGVTRTVLASLWVLVPIAALFLGLSTHVSAILVRRPGDGRAHLWAGILLSLGIAVVLPAVTRIEPVDVQSGRGFGMMLALISRHPLALGIGAALYCFVSATLLGGVLRLTTGRTGS